MQEKGKYLREHQDLPINARVGITGKIGCSNFCVKKVLVFQKSVNLANYAQMATTGMGLV